MTIKKRVKKIGGSLGILIPRDFAEAADIREGGEVGITLVGRQVVIEPLDDSIPHPLFRRAFKAVLRRYGSAFKELAEYDRGTNR